MAYVSSKEMLLLAQKGNYAVGAFNVENMEMAQAVISAAQELLAPVIIQTTSTTLNYATPETFVGMIKSLAQAATVPIALHLDHGDSYERAASCLDAGYSSIMIDGSHSSFDENIKITSEVVRDAKLKNIPVEAELGKVGGKEDDLDGGQGNYTDPMEAVEFVNKTGIDSLAVAIGTAHGIYESTPVLDKERLKEIRKIIDIPLVLHGASGLKNEDMIECVKLGICKINFATELRIAYSDGLKDYFKHDPDVFDPKKYGAMGREYVKELVMEKIKVCASDGKAKEMS